MSDYKALRAELAKAEQTIEELRDEISDKERELRGSYRSVYDFSEDEVKDAFLSKNIPGSLSAVDKWKMEKFFANFNKFTLEQFEQFLNYL